MAAATTARPPPAPQSPAAAGHDREPTRPVDYGAINAAYGLLLVALLAAARRREADDVEIETRELLPLGAATFALSKLVAREKIGTWMREPFVEETRVGRRPRGSRLRHAIGELVTCTRCVGAWSALGLVGLRTASPSSGRLLTAVLATSAVNDFLQAAFKAVCARANQG
jgi:uncharacterized protein DUF1360